jgi:hypothetical protein
MFRVVGEGAPLTSGYVDFSAVPSQNNVELIRDSGREAPAELAGAIPGQARRS